MSWERDPLWAKAKLFFERAFSKQRDEPEFGLWCSFGLELLARAAIASISPTLLAEPDASHRYLLHALGRGSEKSQRKSIGFADVLQLCRTLFKEFTEDDKTSAQALLNRRNEELHTGAGAFNDYPPGKWLAGFYRTCGNLCSAMGETLEALFGEDEALVAKETVVENENDVKQRVLSAIAAHEKVFIGKPDADRDAARASAEANAANLATQRHHRVTCPACKCVATVQGTPFGKEIVSHRDGQIVIRQAVSPKSFSCTACGLRLNGCVELNVAGVGSQYMRTTTMNPEAFYGLYTAEDLEAEVDARFREGARQYVEEQMREYDNEG